MTIQRCAVLSAVALTLVAFSGCSSNDNGQSTTVTAISADAFVAVVQSTVSSSPNNTEPVAIDGIVATSPQTTEPIPSI